MQESFSMFLPVEIIEKAGDKKDANGLPDKLIVAGVASNAKTGKDKDGQTLDVNGFDYSPLLKSGLLNLEHGYAKTKDASLIVGFPTSAFVKNNEFHIQGELFKDNEKGVAMYKLGQMLKKSGSSRTIGYSVEGVPVAFDPFDKSIIRKARITGIALTLSPKNSGTECIFKGGEVEYETQDGSEYLVDIVDEAGQRIVVDRGLNILKGEEIGTFEKAGEGSRGGKVIGHTISGKPIYDTVNHASHKDFSIADHNDAIQAHLNASRDHERESERYKLHTEQRLKHSEAKSKLLFSKAMQAGGVTGRETTDQAMTGEPLKQESIDGVPRKKKNYGKLLADMRRRRGESGSDDFSKAEVFTYLIDAHSMDLESCKNFWQLSAQIHKNLC